MVSKQKLVTGGVLFVFGGIMLRAAMEPRVMLFADEGGMDIMTYPKVLLYILLAATVLYVLKPDPDEADCDWRSLLPCWPALLGAVASFGIYAFAFEYLGLAFSTLLFMLVFFYVMHYRDWRKALPIAVAGALITWLVFEKLLGVAMPRGIWLDWF